MKRISFELRHLWNTFQRVKHAEEERSLLLRARRRAAAARARLQHQRSRGKAGSLVLAAAASAPVPGSAAAAAAAAADASGSTFWQQVHGQQQGEPDELADSEEGQRPRETEQQAEARRKAVSAVLWCFAVVALSCAAACAQVAFQLRTLHIARCVGVFTAGN